MVKNHNDLTQLPVVQDAAAQRRPPGVSVAVIVPVFNERAALAPLLDDLLAAAAEHAFDIIVVDDGSTDGSHDILAGYDGRVRVIRHLSNCGYGAALKTGILETRAANVAFIDSDGQHAVSDLIKLITALDRHEFAIGARNRGSEGSPWERRPWKWLLHRVCTYLAGRAIPDINCGLRAGRRIVYMRMLELLPDGFSFSTTSLLYILQSRYSVTFIPIHARPRQGKSAVRIVSDGLATLLLVLRLMMLFDPIRALGLPAIFLVFVGLLYQVWIFSTAGLHIEGGAVISLLVGVMMFLFALLADQVASLRKEISSHNSLLCEELRTHVTRGNNTCEEK